MHRLFFVHQQPKVSDEWLLAVLIVCHHCLLVQLRACTYYLMGSVKMTLSFVWFSAGRKTDRTCPIGQNKKHVWVSPPDVFFVELVAQALPDSHSLGPEGHVGDHLEEHRAV